MGSFSSVVSENVTREIEYQPKSKVEIFYDFLEDVILLKTDTHYVHCFKCSLHKNHCTIPSWS